ncbi:MAG: CorA family divalent cation transporter [Bacteroidota bacterium]
MLRFLSDTPDLHWVDVTLPTDEELLEVAGMFNIPYSYVRTCLDPEHMPEMLNLSGGVRMISLRMYDDAAPSDGNTARELTQKLVIFSGANFIVTIHRRGNNLFTAFCDRLQSKVKDNVPVEHVVDRALMTVLHSFDEPIHIARENTEIFEEKVFIKADSTLLIKEVFYLKRRIMIIHDLLEATLEISSNLPDVDEHERRHEVEYYNEKLIFRNKEILDSVNSLLNLHLALNAHRTNEVMRILTVFSVLFMPLTFIAGVYGMNFDNMPELRTQNGYFVVLGIMFAIGTSLFMWFRSRGWLKI